MEWVQKKDETGDKQGGEEHELKNERERGARFFVLVFQLNPTASLTGTNDCGSSL